MKAVERIVERIAPTNLPILLVGESGTGKSFFAQRVHEHSARHDDAFLKVICSGLNADAIAGYFHGFHQGSHVGRGTLFLKEINELSCAAQKALLSVILERDAESNGEPGIARLVSSTTAVMEEEVSAGRFRRDLYYRLKGVCLHLPPLRDRKGDIPALADLLMHKHGLLLGVEGPPLDADDFSKLQAWHWPGNIRELDNAIQQMVVLKDAKSVIAELLAGAGQERKDRRSANRFALKAATRAASRRVEEQLILDALAKTRWNRKRAAQELQISYKSLLSKLKLIGNVPGEGVS